MAYQPIYDRNQEAEDLRVEASGRYVLRFAAYETSFNWTAGTSTLAINTTNDWDGSSKADVYFAKSKKSEDNTSHFDIQHCC